MDSPRILTTEPSEAFDDEPQPDEAAPRDLDPATWLARDDKNVTGYVSVRGGRLKVGALTQGEMEALRKGASKPRRDQNGRPTGEVNLDSALLNRLIIANALNKANPGSQVLPDDLGGKLTGDLTEIAKRILALSGFAEVGERDELPFD